MIASTLTKKVHTESRVITTSRKTGGEKRGGDNRQNREEGKAEVQQ